MKSGGGSAKEAGAIATMPMAVIAIVTVATIVASDTLKRVRRRTDEAFTTRHPTPKSASTQQVDELW